MADSEVQDAVEVLVQAFAANVASAVSKLMFHPMERVQIILQTQDADPKIASGTVARYRGIMHVCQRVARENGIGALYRGSSAVLLAAVFPSRIVKSILVDSWTEQMQENSIALLTARAASGLLSLALVYPLDFARIRLCADVGTADGYEFRGPWDCLSRTVRRSGIRSIFSGFGVSLAGILVYRVAFGTVMGLVFPSEGATAQYVVAMSSVAVAGVVAYPFDTVRKRLIVGAGAKEPAYSGAVDCFVQTARREGLGGFWKGVSISVLNGIGGMVLLVGYQLLAEAGEGSQ